jgi:hypothetical protein
MKTCTPVDAPTVSTVRLNPRVGNDDRYNVAGKGADYYYYYYY